MKNIVLIGMSGSGKTTIGRALGKSLNRPFIDTDEEIIKLEERPIEDIFAEDGEAYFRQVESDLVRKLDLRDGSIISTGGGLVLNKENMKLLKETSLVILLKSSIDNLISNLSKSHIKRPLIKEEVMKLDLEMMYRARRDLYFSYADVIIEVDNKGIGQIIDEIILKI